MNERVVHPHLSAETLQALLEGGLPHGERARAEEHLASCARCAAELEAWSTLFRELDGLAGLAPAPGFADRVMDQVAPLPLAARVRAWWGARAGASHPDGERLQDWLDGRLAARSAARVEAHLAGCAACAGEAAAWRDTFAALHKVERFAPAEGFAGRVMAQVHGPAPAPARVPEWRRALAWARGFVPQTRRAWAAVSGVALTPAVTLGLVLWAVLSHPTLTPGALASFTWWKASELSAAAWSALAARALESEGLFQVYAFIGSLAVSPAAVAVAALALCAGTVLASWVLYRNLVVAHPLDGRVAHASLS